jgi:hypothetical protein
MSLTPEQIDDIVQTTLNNYRRDVWLDLSMPLQKYFAMGNLILNNKVGVDGGMSLQWQVRLTNAGNAKVIGLYEKDAVNIDQTIKSASVPFKFAQTSWAYDVKEDAFNSSPAALISAVKARQIGAMNDMAELMETLWWGKPADSTDDKTPYGLLYWLVPNVTEGFNGQNPSGFSSVAGLDSSASLYSGWRNYTGTYAAISKDDLIRKIRKAMYKTKFIAPIPYPKIEGDGITYAICSVYDLVAQLEEMLEAQNDNLGNDVASKDGMVLIRGNKVTPIPYLDTNAGTGTAWQKLPVIGINLNHFKCIFKKGHMMRRSNVTPGDSHDSRAVFYDSSLQFVNYDRRSNFYLYST